MIQSRLVDRIYIAFVVLIGTWSLWRYYTYCFSDVISAITARSLIITTTTTHYTIDELSKFNLTGGGVFINRDANDNANGNDFVAEEVVRSQSRRDQRSPNEVKDDLRNAKKAKQDERTSKKEQKAAAELALAALQQHQGKSPPSYVDNAFIPSIDDAKIAAQMPQNNNKNNNANNKPKSTTKKTIVKPLTFHDRFTPIVIRDLVWLLVSLVCSGMMVWSYYVAVTTDPGMVPKCFSIYAQKASRMALSTGGTLSKCTICQVFKPPRCHHCSKCGRCVLKYDHHCYWIGQCVGYFNYKVFLNFCFWTCLFTNVASLSLSRSVYLFFFEVVNSVTDGQNAIHALTETTTVYFRESPILGSTEVTKVPITFDVIILFLVYLFAGWLSWYMVKKHYFLARDNKTTVEEMILDGDPSPYSLSTTHNWEEVFGDRHHAVKGPLRWLRRLVPTLAYGRQRQSEIDSEEYFSLLKEEKRKQRLMRDYKSVGGILSSASNTSYKVGNYGATNNTNTAANAPYSITVTSPSSPSAAGRRVHISDRPNSIVAAPSPYSSFPNSGREEVGAHGGLSASLNASSSSPASLHLMALGAVGTTPPSSSSPPTHMGGSNSYTHRFASRDTMGSATFDEDATTEATLSQPSSSNTDDEEKQNAKEEKRRANSHKLQRRKDRRDRRFRSPQQGGGSSSMFVSNGSVAYSLGSSAAEGMTPYNPPHTPPDRDLVGDIPMAMLGGDRSNGTQSDGERRCLLGNAYSTDREGGVEGSSAALPNHGGAGSDGPGSYDVEVLTVETGGSGRGGRGAIVELCPQGTHFAKHIADSSSEAEEEELRQEEAVAATPSPSPSTPASRSRKRKKKGGSKKSPQSTAAEEGEGDHHTVNT